MAFKIESMIKPRGLTSSRSRQNRKVGQVLVKIKS